MKDFFPLGLAGGDNFCNREAERHHLLSNIRQMKPTLIISPRRYGKTSLVLQTIAESKLPYSHIDLFSEVNQKDIVKSILKSIGELIGKISSTPQRAMNTLKEFFAGAQIKLAIGVPGVSIDFDMEHMHHKNQLDTILSRFNTLVEKNKKKVVLFFDEFQRLGQVAKDYSIEAVLRHFAQKSKNICFIFSGSHRHLLNQMFDDSRRPFYKLCDRIVLTRIESEAYFPYIQAAAYTKWKRKITPNTINAILMITEQHPYYVNLLCSRLWLTNKLPTESDVASTWKKIAAEEKSQLGSEIDLLSDNQRNLLITLAKTGKIKALQSKDFIARIELSASSIAQSLAVLQERDYVYCDTEGFYRLVDPLLNYILSS